MAIFYDFVYMLNNAGLADVFMPFVLVFVIVFAVLHKTKILGVTPEGKAKKNLNVMVALVMGFSVVMAHFFQMYPESMDPVIIINNSLTSVSLVLVATLMVLILVGSLFGGKTLSVDGGFKISNIIKFLAVGIILYIFALNMGWVTFGYATISRSTQITVVSLLVFGLVVWFVVKGNEKKDPDRFKEYQPIKLLEQRPKKK